MPNMLRTARFMTNMVELSAMLRKMARRASMYRRRTREVWRRAELTRKALDDMSVRYTDLMDLLDVYEVAHSVKLIELQSQLRAAHAEIRRLRDGVEDPVIW